MSSRQRRAPRPLRLCIDTCSGDVGRVALRDGSRVLVERTVPLVDVRDAPALLRAVAGLCADAGVAMPRIGRIDVVPGPGKFSRVRLGVVTANALAWAIGTPVAVCGRPVRIARPTYGAEPRIGGQ